MPGSVVSSLPEGFWKTQQLCKAAWLEAQQCSAQSAVPTSSCFVLHAASCTLPFPPALQVYGAVTMNNTLVLGLFLVVVYLRKLQW
jgi:hypothetical protein